jgi:hypothetical protein
VPRPALEVAGIFRDHGPAWRDANRGHVSLLQLKVMSAIEDCRTGILGGHVARCENALCGFTSIAYNSCRNRHCPKCQSAQARDWMSARQADLLPVPYFHVVFTLPAQIGAIAYHNKAVIYDLLFKAASETMLTIANDPKHLGAKIGITAVLHTWGSAMTHHPHVHMIVPGGGISGDGTRWIATKPGFFLPVLVLSRLFRRLMLDKLAAAHAAGKLEFFGTHSVLAVAARFSAGRSSTMVHVTCDVHDTARDAKSVSQRWSASPLRLRPRMASPASAPRGVKAGAILPRRSGRFVRLRRTKDAGDAGGVRVYFEQAFEGFEGCFFLASFAQDEAWKFHGAVKVGFERDAAAQVADHALNVVAKVVDVGPAAPAFGEIDNGVEELQGEVEVFFANGLDGGNADPSAGIPASDL